MDKNLKAELRLLLSSDIHPSFVQLVMGKDRKNLQCVFFQFISLIETKCNLLYIRNQSVPRCKHFPPQL